MTTDGESLDDALRKTDALLKKSRDLMDEFDLAHPEFAQRADEQDFMEGDLGALFGPRASDDRNAGGAEWLIGRASEIIAAECEDRSLSEWDLYQFYQLTENASPRVRRALDTLWASACIIDPAEEDS